MCVLCVSLLVCVVCVPLLVCICLCVSGFVFVCFFVDEVVVFVLLFMCSFVVFVCVFRLRCVGIGFDVFCVFFVLLCCAHV